MLIHSDGEDLKIYHSSSNNSSYIAESGTGDLNISGTIMSLKASNNDTYIRCVEDSYVRLYHDNATVLQTQSNGINVTGNVIATGAVKPTTYQETYVSKSAASTVTCDLATANHFAVTLDQNTTFAFTNPPSSGTSFAFTLIVTQHSTAVTLTWPSSVDWAGGSAPDAAAANEVQAYGFITRDGGTTYYGFLGGTAIG